MRFKTTVPAILAEFIGTYALVFFGCGAIILSELENLSSAVIPIIFGLTITIFVYLLGRFSGAHFNPAVTIGFLLNKEISIKDSVFYIGIQILGGMLASRTHVALFGRMHSFGVTTLSVDIGQGFFLEAFCTGLLMFVILQVTREENNIYGIAIGGTVFISALLIGEYTGGSLNPARSIGPALVSGKTREIYFYVLAPVIGSLISSKLFTTKFSKNSK
ncbi:aquaporin [Candidatus Actinomarina sp.]|jgi:aquaporin NIP|nr:aquaporin [Candidatus Actinomarina sp.]MDA8922743.1 aquaporin [Acidimicrobiia bacterium]MDA8710285.1 aquaporin [Candidatus Actinomarina sp.]MDA9179138.1 aquaporin [Acidimicrobiia bacterium]MDB4833243.1 aquaporin [Acidimicrobiia bacterium]